ncbi:hypothetical protein PVL29_015174 [Vitis rotundifolia]|uniref:UBC core domain-containing protein n=1 Tax=Vitis rotundifolia TaxID=103349 RepID=A0AA39DJE0_VITRO|nr:hypothetical protein PVL29_015174 [Vitis rotundifolia]
MVRQIAYPQRMLWNPQTYGKLELLISGIVLGRMCLDILKDKWSPALQIRTVLLSIQALLSAPNPDDPLSENIAKHWKSNEAEAVETAKEWTRLYASGA